MRSYLLLEGLGIDTETLFLLAAKPRAWYEKDLDAFCYLARDGECHIERGPRNNVELFTDGVNVIGFRVLDFLTMPGEERDAFIEATMEDLDDIRGIEDIWIHNLHEMLPDIERSETEFFEELRRRQAMGLIDPDEFRPRTPRGVQLLPHIGE